MSELRVQLQLSGWLDQRVLSFDAVQRQTVKTQENHLARVGVDLEKLAASSGFGV